MSLAINGSDPTSRTSATNDDDDKKSADASKKSDRSEFDFAGAAYSRAHVPSGMIGASATPARLKADAYDVAAKASKIAQDLKSPELRDLLGASGKFGVAAVKIFVATGELAKAAPEAVTGSPVAIVKLVVAAGDIVVDGLDLCRSANELKAADTPAAKEKLAELLHDLAALQSSQQRLAVDARKFTFGV